MPMSGRRLAYARSWCGATAMTPCTCPVARHISAGRIAWDRLDLDSWWDRVSGRSAGSESGWLK